MAQILVVEDERVVAEDIQRSLQSFGYAVPAIVATGEDAIKKVEEYKPDIVLMDIVLRGEMDGIEAANQIRSRFNIPIIYLTAHTDEKRLKRAKITEPFGYIIKPFEDREVYTAIEMALYKYGMEKKLKESEKWLSITLKSIGDAVIATDTKGYVIFMNLVAQSLTGWKHEEAVGKPLKDIFNIINEETGKQVENPIKKAIQEGIAADLTNRALLIAKDGMKTSIEDSCAPIRDDKGDIVGGVLVFRDITERKWAEEEREKMQAQLLQAQKLEAIGRLTAGIAHDFNNMLLVIQGYTNMLMMKVDETDPLHGYLKEIYLTCTSVADLISKLLLFSRKQPMKLTSLNINRAVDDLLKMLNRLIGENIAVSTDLEPDLWMVRADEGNIEHVIMNLVVNARDAMSMTNGGNLTIKTENVTLDEDLCKVIPEARPGKFVSLSVADTGVGMDKKTIQRIFEPFFSTKDAGAGTGLGLSVVYGIVKEHGGWINVYSEPGQGSTLKFYLPAFSVKQKDETEEKILLQELQGSGERILLVEDEEKVRDVITMMLRENGYIVFGAASAGEALDIFEREKGKFHMVFIDVVLPDKSGLQLVDQLLSRKPELPVLLSSGYVDSKSHGSVIRKRGFRFLQKPYALTELLRAIRETIE